MAEFYGKLTGRGASVSRAGQRNYGLTTIAASWEGAIQVILSHNYETGQNEFNIQMIPWYGHGKYIDLAKGQLNGENINLIDKYRYNLRTGITIRLWRLNNCFFCSMFRI